VTVKNLKSPTERAEVSRTAIAYCPDGVTETGLTELLEALLALDIWPASYDGGPATVAALKNLTSEFIGRFCVAAQQATLHPDLTSPFSHTSPIGHSFTRHATTRVDPRRQRLECPLLKAISTRYVMNRAGVVAAQARERELLTELAHAIERGAPHTLDPLLRPSWEAAGTDAAHRRVTIDQVASLTDTSAIAWHHRLCVPGAS